MLLDELINLSTTDESPPPCEATVDGAPCTRPAAYRVTVLCTCTENHPKTVVLLCETCTGLIRDEPGIGSVIPL